MSNKKINLELDQYESGAVFQSLKDKRNAMLAEGRATDVIDDVLLKLISLMEIEQTKQKRGRWQREER